MAARRFRFTPLGLNAGEVREAREKEAAGLDICLSEGSTKEDQEIRGNSIFGGRARTAHDTKITEEVLSVAEIVDQKADCSFECFSCGQCVGRC